MLEFFTNPMSRGRMVRWMLEETGAAYEERIVEYGPAMKGPDYLAINPMGKVPALRHDGAVVTEVAAICTYLASAFPEAGLAPRDDERAAFYRWMFFAAGPLEQAITNNSAGFKPTEEQGRMLGYGSFDMATDILAKHLDKNTFVTGDRFTAADVYVGAHVDFGLSFGSLPEQPALRSYRERAIDRDAYRRAKARDDELMAEARA